MTLERARAALGKQACKNARCRRSRLEMRAPAFERYRMGDAQRRNCCRDLSTNLPTVGYPTTAGFESHPQWCVSLREMITLFDHPLSPYAQKAKIALLEKRLAFVARLPARLSAGSTEVVFANANPRLEVPALIDGDVQVFDSSILLQYLEDAYPSPPLLPASPADRARVRMLEEAMDTTFEAITWGIAEIRYFGRAEGGQAAAMLAKASRQLAGLFAWLERQLGEREWFNGEDFGWGDLCVAPCVNGASRLDHPPPLNSTLRAWLGRVNIRPSVAQATTEADGWLQMSDRANAKDLIATGRMVRRYRDHRLEWMMKSGGADIVMNGLEQKNIRFSPELD